MKTEEKQRKRDPISTGLLPSGRHGGHGPEGKLSFHLGRRPRKKKEGDLSPLSWWHQSVTGATIVTTIYTNNFAVVL